MGWFIGHYLLKWGSTQLDSDVLKLTVPLSAEITNDIRVLVGLSEQLNLPVCKAEALWEDSFHRHWTVVKLPPCGEENKHWCNIVMCTVSNGSVKATMNCCEIVQTYLYTIVPSAPWPKTSLGLKAMFPTLTILVSSSEKSKHNFKQIY